MLPTGAESNSGRATAWISPCAQPEQQPEETRMTVKALTFDTRGTILHRHRATRGAVAGGGAGGLGADWSAVTTQSRRRSHKGIVNAERPAYNFDDVHRAKLD